MGIAIERKDWANPKTVTIKVSLKEAFSGTIETYTFADLNETSAAK